MPTGEVFFFGSIRDADTFAKSLDMAVDAGIEVDMILKAFREEFLSRRGIKGYGKRARRPRL
jgi:hypothetical protein